MPALTVAQLKAINAKFSRGNFFKTDHQNGESRETKILENLEENGPQGFKSKGANGFKSEP